MSQGLAQHGAIQLNRSSGPLGGHFPPPPPQGLGVSPRPIVMNGNTTQRQHAGDMMQSHRHPALLGQHHQSLAVPPHPPRGLVPEGLRNGPAVQVCDIRKEPGRLTETDAREELSDYLIFRFELADRDKLSNDDGEIIKPTWAKVVRTEVKGISKAEATRQIKDLNDDTSPLGVKKASLTETQQRQLEKVLEELELREVDDRFHYVLVQIDRKLQKKVVGASSSRDRFRSPSRSARSDRRYDNNRRHGNKYRKYSDARGRTETIVYADSRGRRRSVVKEKRGKTVMETVSLTAYYKRCPKAEVDSVALLLQRDALLARQLQPPNPHQTYAPQQLHQEDSFGVQHRQYQPQANHNAGSAPRMPMTMNGNMNMGMPPPPIGDNARRSSQANQPPPIQMPRPPIGNNMMRPNHPNQMAPNHVPRPPMGNSMSRPTPPPVRVLQNQGPNRAPHHPSFPPQRGNNNRGRSTSSSSSGTDFDSSSDNDAASVLTPNSSRSSNSYSFAPATRTKERRGSRGSKYIEEPRHFGVPPKKRAPHKAHQHQEHRISDDFINLGPTGSNAHLVPATVRRDSHSPGPFVPRHDGLPRNRGSVLSRKDLHSPAPVLPRHNVPSIPSTVPSPRSSPATPTRLTPPYPLDLEEIEAKAYLVGRADGKADIHGRIDVSNVLPPRHLQQQVHQAERLTTHHPPLLRRTTLPASLLPHTTGDLRALLGDDRRTLPIPVSRGVTPKVLSRRPSIRHIRSDYPRHGYGPLDRQSSVERERDRLESLERFRRQDDMARRRGDDRYYDDIELERRLRNMEIDDELTVRAERLAIEREMERDEAVRGRLRRGREEGMTYGGEGYDDERERSPFVSIRPSIARRATVGYGYRR